MAASEKPEKTAYVYMVRCAGGQLYTGWTNDPEARPTHSLCLALCKVVYSSLVRGRFSDHHKVGFLTISRSVFRLYEGRFSGHQLVGKLYLWHTRHFHI